MATDINLATYPFDPTGRAAANKITGELQTITGSNFRDYHFIIPKLAPFFSDGLVVRYRDLNNQVRTLVEGVDYYLTHWFISASRACAKDVFGSISFLDVLLTGTISLDYQTVGGIWTQDDAKIAEILADKLHNPRITAWDVVVDMPISFPVIDHQWDLADMVGTSAMVTALESIEAALRQTGATGITDHINNKDNPHDVTAAQVNLGLVRNLTTSDIPTAQAGLSDDVYMTPKSTAAAITAQVTTAFNQHKTNYANPHNVTAGQTGAYTKTEVDALLTGKVSTNQAAFDALHFDGKSPVEYKDWVLTGTAANTLALNGMSYTDLVTDVLSGKVADSYKLDGRTFDDLVAAVSTQANSNATTFDGRTFAQAEAEILLGTAANSLKFDGRTYVQAKSDILSGQAADSVLFAGKTPAQVAADVLTGKAADSTLFDGRTYDELIYAISQGTVADSLKFNGLTYSAVKADILSSTASNASLLEGHSYQEIVSTLSGAVATDTAMFDGRTFAVATAEILSGKAADSYKFDGMTPVEYATNFLPTYYGSALTSVQQHVFPEAIEADPVTNPVIWTALAKINSISVVGDKPQDCVWIVTGGEGSTEGQSSTYLISASFRGATPVDYMPVLNVTRIAGPDNVNISFCLETDSGAGVAYLQMKSASNRKPVTVTVQSVSTSEFMSTTTPVIVNVEPASVVYPAVSDSFVLKSTYDSDMAAIESAFNDLTTAFNDIKTLISA